MKYETHDRYQSSAVYRGKSYVTRESMLGKLNFFGMDNRTRGATITVLTPDNESKYMASCDASFSTVALIFIGQQPSEALCHYATNHELPLLILSKLAPLHHGKIALLDSRTATLYVAPNLEILARYARQLRFCTESSLFFSRLLPHFEAFPLNEHIPNPFQHSKLLSYSENGPLSLAYGEDALLDTLGSVAEEMIGMSLMLPVHARSLHSEEGERAFRARLRAILRAAVCGSFSLLFEGLYCADDVKNTFSIVEDVKKELRDHGFEYKDDLPCGILVQSLLLLHELPLCPPTSFLCLDVDRILSTLFSPFMGMPPSPNLKRSAFSFLNHSLKNATLPICVRTVHPPLIHEWKLDDARACNIEAFFISPEHHSLWQAWKEAEE